MTGVQTCALPISFCAISQHQGTRIQSRSEASILQEIRRLSQAKWFRGSISDLGGPSANMYQMRCGSSAARSACRRGSCLAPARCPNLLVADAPGARLLRTVRGTESVKHLAISSGIRFDLMDLQPAYLGELLAHHVGGLLKVAPEHLVDGVTILMGKPGRVVFEKFLNHFRAESERLGKKQHVLPYLMSGHPGCRLADMVELALLLKKYRLKVEQVQDFTPTPGTLSTCMFYTGTNPFTGKEVYVPRSDREKRLQKALLLSHLPAERSSVFEALEACNRKDAGELLLGIGKKLDKQVAGAGKTSVIREDKKKPNGKNRHKNRLTK